MSDTNVTSRDTTQKVISVAGWALLVLGPVNVAFAWSYGWLTFEWAVITLLLYIYYLQGEFHDI